MRRFILTACSFLLFSWMIFGQPTSEKSDKPHYETKSMSPEEFERELAKSKHYNFEYASPDGLVDSEGVYIRAADITAYLHEKQIDPGAYVLIWITRDSPSLKDAATTVDPLGRFGLTKIVFRQKPNQTPLPITGHYHPAPGTPTDPAAAQRIVFRKNPKSITAGAPFPDISKRPPSLRPQPLPPTVRYAFSDDATVALAVDAILEELVSNRPAGGKLFGANVTLQSGVWEELKTDEHLGKKNSLPWVTEAEFNQQKVRKVGITLRDAEEIGALEKILRQQIASSGGAEIRALTTDEMARWWPYVPFDYVEPLLVVETKDHALAYALLFEKGRAVLLDDLKRLPSAASRPTY